MASLSWGIIGCGKVCEKKSGPALAGVEGSRLAAVMRRTGNLAEDFAKRHGVPRWYDTWEGLLSDDEVEAVYVATPNNTHLEPVLAAARAGKHVLCEKPMARNTAACQEMIDTCKEMGVILGVAYYRRAYPTILRAKEMIDSGAIGAVKTVRINDEFPLSHRLDLVHFLCGDAEAVWSKVEPAPPGSHLAETAVLHVRTLGGAEGIMNIDWEEHLTPEMLDIEGESGSVVIDDLKGGHLVVRAGGEEREESFAPLAATHWGLVANFVAHWRGEAPLACDGVEGRKSTVILDIVQELEPGGGERPVDYAGREGADPSASRLKLAD